MTTTTKERCEVIDRLRRIGIGYDDAQRLRRISMTLRRWFEGECGTDHGCIERDEETGKTYWLNGTTGKRYRVPDRETGAKLRLATMMTRYPTLVPYIQGDCRGAALYVLTQEQATQGNYELDCIYNRGVAIY